MALKREAYQMLEAVVGLENISEDPAVLDGYTWQLQAEHFGEIGLKFMPNRPEAVVLPNSTEEVQGIVKTCNRYGMKFKAHSTGWGAWGAPGREGVVMIDLRRMNRILEIDGEDMFAVVEPYANWAQLHVVYCVSVSSVLDEYTSLQILPFSCILAIVVMIQVTDPL